jgi:hypothetical protein
LRIDGRSDSSTGFNWQCNRKNHTHEEDGVHFIPQAPFVFEQDDRQAISQEAARAAKD